MSNFGKLDESMQLSVDCASYDNGEECYLTKNYNISTLSELIFIVNELHRHLDQQMLHVSNEPIASVHIYTDHNKLWLTANLIWTSET